MLRNVCSRWLLPALFAAAFYLALWYAWVRDFLIDQAAGFWRGLFGVALASLMLVTSGCLGTDQRVALRQAAIATIQSYNDAGIDPLQLDPQQLAILVATCASATAILSVWNADIPDAPATIADFCAVVMKAAAPAPGV